MIIKIEKPFPQLEGCEFFLAGGCVRDSILEKPIKDRDFVVITDKSFKELCEDISKVGEVFMAKPEFLTIRCRIGNEILDIAVKHIYL